MDGSLRGDSQAARLIWTISPPVIGLIGIVGNITTILVFVRKQRQSSTTLYLTCVAAGDLAVMILVYPRWWLIYVFHTDIRLWNDFACKLHIMITYSGGLVSYMALNVVTIERIIIVTKPYTAKFICSRRSARWIICILAVLPLVINGHLLYGYGLVDHLDHDKSTDNSPDKSPLNIAGASNVSSDEGLDLVNNSVQKCVWTRDKIYAHFYDTIFAWLVFVVNAFLPLIISIVGSVTIIWKTTVSKNLRRRMKNAAGSNGKHQSDKSRQITITLLFIVLAFLLCTLPVHVFMVIRRGWDPNTRMTEIQEVLWAIFNQLYYVNHAINFILFAISGRRFREDVKELYGCKRSSGARPKTDMSLSYIASTGSNYFLDIVNTNPSGPSLSTVS